MKQAFCYMFKDNKFYQKYLYYFILMSICTFLLTYSDYKANAQLFSIQTPLMKILGTLILTIPTGYSYSCIKALISQKENFILPAVNLKKNFVTGFKFDLATLLICLPFLLIFLVLAIIFPLLVICLLLVIVAYSLSFRYIFANTESITTFFQFKTSIKLVNNSGFKYWLGLLIIIILETISGVISTQLFKITHSLLYTAVTAIISSIIASYVMFVNAYITAKAIKNT